MPGTGARGTVPHTTRPGGNLRTRPLAVNLEEVHAAALLFGEMRPVSLLDNREDFDLHLVVGCQVFRVTRVIIPGSLGHAAVLTRSIANEVYAVTPPKYGVVIADCPEVLLHHH